MELTEKLTEDIINISRSQNIAVIGIDGLGGAGKSTISESICKALTDQGINTVLLHIDDLITRREIRYDPAYPQWQCYYDLQWRYDYFRELISRAKTDNIHELEAELYDKENDSYFTEKYRITQNTVIVVEGIFLQRKELDGIFDYMVYIDIPEDVRLERVLRRDTYIGDENSITEKYEKRYFPAERHYVNEYHPEKAADMVIRA